MLDQYRDGRRPALPAAARAKKTLVIENGWCTGRRGLVAMQATN